jgi:hypothetical protein
LTVAAVEGKPSMMTLVLALGLVWMPVQAADGGLAARPSAVADSAEPAYVGAQVCAECHPDEAVRWRGSDHDWAMTEVGEQTVLGDFDGATFTAHGLTSRFFRRDGRYWVETEGPTGTLQTYPIRYTFGSTAPAVSDRVPRRAAPEPGDRLGQPRPHRRRSTLVPALSQRTHRRDPSAALDRARAELELPVRRVPFDQSAQGL